MYIHEQAVFPTLMIFSYNKMTISRMKTLHQHFGHEENQFQLLRLTSEELKAEKSCDGRVENGAKPSFTFYKKYEKSFLSQVEKMLSLASSSKECIITFLSPGNDVRRA